MSFYLSWQEKAKRDILKNLCKKASQKIWAVSRWTNYLNDSEQKKLLFNVIIKYQFSCFPLVWLYCSRETLRIVLKDHVSDFDVLHHKSNDISIHHRNIQILMIELCNLFFLLSLVLLLLLLLLSLACLAWLVRYWHVSHCSHMLYQFSLFHFMFFLFVDLS